MSAVRNVLDQAEEELSAQRDLCLLLTFKTWRHVLTINPLAKYTAPSAVILLFLKTQNKQYVRFEM